MKSARYSQHSTVSTVQSAQSVQYSTVSTVSRVHGVDVVKRRAWCETDLHFGFWFRVYRVMMLRMAKQALSHTRRQSENHSPDSPYG